MKIGQNAFRTQALIAAALALTAPAVAWAGVVDTFYERAFVVAADQRCDLFRPELGAALTAATAQARGAALRSGVREADLNATAARARARAHAVACDSRDLQTVRSRVDGAFSGWARTARMTFPGEDKAWVANRAGYDRPTWRLVQNTIVGASPVAFGYSGQGAATELTAVVSFQGRSRPYAARLVMRDPAKAPRAWLAGEGLAPAALRTSVWSTGYAAAQPTLLAEGRRAGETWRFPATASAQLERLDPRESFAVEFHFRDGTMATARFEAGDFAAGRAFLAMGML